MKAFVLVWATKGKHKQGALMTEPKELPLKYNVHGPEHAEAFGGSSALA